jgi:phosphoribosylformylglycinamidine synthase
MMNKDLQFICQHQYIRVENNHTPFTKGIAQGTVLDIPIAHKEGNYFIDAFGLKALQDNDQIVFRYCDKEGNTSLESNPNGSLDNIAGICNFEKNVLGMMPHPERAVSDAVMSQDGLQIIQAIEAYFGL